MLNNQDIANLTEVSRLCVCVCVLYQKRSVPYAHSLSEGASIKVSLLGVRSPHIGFHAYKSALRK